MDQRRAAAPNDPPAFKKYINVQAQQKSLKIWFVFHVLFADDSNRSEIGFKKIETITSDKFEVLVSEI